MVDYFRIFLSNAKMRRCDVIAKVCTPSITAPTGNIDALLTDGKKPLLHTCYMMQNQNPESSVFIEV